MFIQCEQMKTYFDLLISSLTTSNFKFKNCYTIEFQSETLLHRIGLLEGVAANMKMVKMGNSPKTRESEEFPKYPGIWEFPKYPGIFEFPKYPGIWGISQIPGNLENSNP